MERTLALVEETTDGQVGVVPFVDGTSLVDLVDAYETHRRYAPAGGYAGLSPSSFDLRPEPTTEPARVWLLGCDCGEAGCWPLTASVQVVDDVVVWSDFEQPHRPNWDYDGFGPFRFDRTQYDAAVQAAVRR